MGTRGFMGVVIDDEMKIGYMHWDSYPDGVGKDVLETLRALLLVDTNDDVAKLARGLKVVKQDTPPTAAERAALAEYADQGVSTRDLGEWYVLLRKTQGNFGEMLRAGYIEDASDFPYDSLYAEWGYLVDFDTKTFEAYEGFQTKPHDLGRFAKGSGPDRMKSLGHNYFPCALAGMWSFDALPTSDEFVSALDRSDDEDED
jgi:hypothetical protein